MPSRVVVSIVMHAVPEEIVDADLAATRDEEEERHILRRALAVEAPLMAVSDLVLGF